MSEAELARLRQDLEVIQEAAALDLPFGRRDVWLSLGMVPSGLVIVVWAAVGPWESVAFSLIPLLLLALTAGGYQMAQYRRAASKRQQRHEWVAAGLVAAGFGLLLVWERGLGLPARPVRGAGFIFAGVLCLILALSSRQRRVALAATVALVPFGLVLPLCSPQQVAVAGGGAVALAGAVAAAVLALQLRAESTRRE